jgi:hypothetical protein
MQTSATNMQTAYPEQVSPATLFSRERRRQRMLQFLQAFERRSWRCAPEAPFLVPLSKDDLRDDYHKREVPAQD